MVIQTVGITSCLGGPERQCGYAAEMLRNELACSKNTNFQLQWHLIHPNHIGSTANQLISLNKSISQYSALCFKAKQPFLVIGGDHSCALGTWGGILNTLEKPDQLGLIWLDAHLDAHTFSTSHSGNIHGMPVAALLGHADTKLALFYPSTKKMNADHFKMLGVRSYEAEEYQLLKQQNVSITFADQMRSLPEFLCSTVNQLNQTCQFIGISIDLDVVDPKDAPGVETPEKGGVLAADLIKAISNVKNNKKICALEISEFNPENDVNNRTLDLIKDIVTAFFEAN